MHNYGSQSLMVGFNDVIDQKIINFANSFIPFDCQKDPENNQGIVTEPHVSLLTDIKDAVLLPATVTSIKTFPAFKINFGSISFFKNDNVDVIKIEIESPELTQLHYLVKNLIPNSYRFDEYNAHCTLAFVKPNSCDFILQNSNYFRGMSHTVEWIEFNSAMGVSHSIKINQK